LPEGNSVELTDYKVVAKAFSENPFLAAALVIYNRMNIAVFRDNTPKITCTFYEEDFQN